MRSKTARTRARGLLSAVLRLVAGQTKHPKVACIAAVGGGWLQWFSPQSVVQRTRAVQMRRLTNVEQHNLGRLPSLDIKGCGSHAGEWLLSCKR
jgi:hypothetical protein